jgi:hypothetical protein
VINYFKICSARASAQADPKLDLVRHRNALNVLLSLGTLRSPLRALLPVPKLYLLSEVHDRVIPVAVHDSLGSADAVLQDVHVSELVFAWLTGTR